MTSPLDVEKVKRGNAYLKGLHGKIERKEELSLREKRHLLRTGLLPYKALAVPESLTPAERNRILNMPPPDVVTANILRVTNGAMSTPDEVFQAALDNAAAMASEELDLIMLSFRAPESLYERTASFSWVGKLGRAGYLAFNAIVPDRAARAHRAAVLASGLLSPGSFEATLKQAQLLAAKEPLDTPEKHAAYHANYPPFRASI
jgi:hypothetical protein